MQTKLYLFIIALLAVTFGCYIYLFPPVKPTPMPAGKNQPVCVDCQVETVGEPIGHFKKVVEKNKYNTRK